MASRRSSQSSAATFLLADWRFGLQWAMVLVLWALVATAGDVLTRAGAPVLPLSVLLATRFATVLLLLPFCYLFLLTGRCLLPGRRPLVPRLLALGLWSLFVLLLVGSGKEAGKIDEIYWAADPRQGSWGLYMAGAVALAVGGGLVTSFRFLSEARNALTAGLRLIAVLALVAGLFLRGPVETMLSPQKVSSGVLPDLHLILILDDFDFAAANLFLAETVDDSWRDAARSVRPVALPVVDTSGQLVTLFTGLMPYEHGLRGSSWSLSSWQPVEAFWQQRMGALAATAGVHATNVPYPSLMDLFFGSGDGWRIWSGYGQTRRSTGRPLVQNNVPGVRCPDATRSPAYKAFLTRMKESVLPFDVQDLLSDRLPALRCLAGTATVEDIVHEEFAAELIPAWRRAASAHAAEGIDTRVTGSREAVLAASKRMFSFWSVDLARLGGAGTAGDDEARVREQGQRLLRLLGQLSQNAKTLAPGAPFNIHVVGLARQAAGGDSRWGSYIEFSPGKERSGVWPLPDENLPLGLEEIGGLAGFAGPLADTDGHARVQLSPRPSPRVFYQEVLPQSEPSGPVAGSDSGALDTATGRAVGVRRSATCLFWGHDDGKGRPEPTTPSAAERYVSLSGSIDHLAADVRWSEPLPGELVSSVRVRRDDCEVAIRRAIQESIDRDVHLLEPYRLRAAEDLLAEAAPIDAEVRQ